MVDQKSAEILGRIIHAFKTQEFEDPAIKSRLFAESGRIVEVSLSHLGLETLPELPEQFNLLEGLHLGYNRLSEANLPENRSQKLKRLHLESNRLRIFPENIGALQELECLYLANNKIYSLPELLLYLPKIRRIDLTGNTLDSYSNAIIKKLRARGISVSR